MIVRALYIGLLASLALTSASCSKPSTQSSNAALSSGTPTWYGPQPSPPNNHFGTVSTLVTTPPSGPCSGGPTGAQQIVSAWEARDDGSPGNANAVFVGVSCPNSATPVAINQITSAVGNPQGWPISDGMNFVGLPFLVPVGPPGWIALVSLVTIGARPDTSFATNIVIVLSQTGGMSWTDPHLVAATDDIQGGIEPGTLVEGQVNADLYGSGLAATASAWTDTVTHANDIFVAWTVFAGGGTSSFFRQVGWDSTGTWVPTFPAASPLCIALNEPSLTTGIDPTFGNFVFLVDPNSPSVPPMDGICAQFGSPAPVSQTWQASLAFAPFTQFSWSGEEGFTAGTPNPTCFPHAANISVPTWPQCVTGDHSTTSLHVNIARAPLTYDSPDALVVGAVTNLRPSDTSNSVRVETHGWPLVPCSGSCTSPAQPGAPSLTGASIRNDNVPPGSPNDQFQPWITYDSGSMFIAWVDTAESPNNEPSSIHAQVGPVLTNYPNHVLFPTPSYPLGPAPALDLGLYNGAGPFGDGVHFGVGFCDGWDTPTAPNGQGGVYNVLVGP